MLRPVTSCLFFLVSLTGVSHAGLQTASQKPTAPAPAASEPGVGTRRARLEQALKAAQSDLGAARTKLAELSGAGKEVQQRLLTAQAASSEARKRLNEAELAQQQALQSLKQSVEMLDQATVAETAAAVRLAEAERKLKLSSSVLDAAQGRLAQAEKAQPDAPAADPGSGMPRLRERRLSDLLADRRQVELSLEALKQRQAAADELARKEAELKSAHELWLAGVRALAEPRMRLRAALQEWQVRFGVAESALAALQQARKELEAAEGAAAQAEIQKKVETAATASANAAEALRNAELELATVAGTRTVSVPLPARPTEPGADLKALRDSVAQAVMIHAGYERGRAEAVKDQENRRNATATFRKKFEAAKTELAQQEQEVERRRAAAQKAEAEVRAVQAQLGPGEAAKAAEARVRTLETLVARVEAELNGLSGKGSRWQVTLTKVPAAQDVTSAIVWGDPANSASREVFAAFLDGTIRRGQSTTSGRLLFDPAPVFTRKGEQFSGLARSGDRLAAGTGHGEVVLLATAGGPPKATLRKGAGREQYVRALAFHPKHPEILAVGSRDGELELWDTSRPGVKLDSLSLKRTVLSVSFSHDGQYLAVGTRAATGVKAPTAAVYRIVQNGTLLDKNEPLALEHPQQVSSVAFHPSRLELVTACADGLTRWFRSLEAKAAPVELLSLTGKSPETSSVLVSVFGGPDGNFLLTGDTDGWLKLYDLAPSIVDPVRSPVLLAEQKAHGGKIVAAALSPAPDARSLGALSGGVDFFIGFSSFSQR